MRNQNVQAGTRALCVLSCLCLLSSSLASQLSAQEALPADSSAVDKTTAVADTVSTAVPEAAPATDSISTVVPETAPPKDSLSKVAPQATSLPDTLAGDSAAAPSGAAITPPVPQTKDTAVSDSLAVPAGPPSAAKLQDVGFPVTGGDRLGACVITLPDQNSDGRADVAVGVAGCDRKAPNAGAVLILSGHSGDTLRILEGERAGDAFGASLATADLDLDRVPDLVIAATHWDQDTISSIDAGKLYVYSGGTGDRLYVVPGEQGGARLGEGLTALGDVNGDGVPDLAASQALCSYDSFAVAGPACVLLLSGKDGTMLHRVLSAQRRDGFGSSLGSAGDVDADGSCDLLVGAYRESHEELLSTGAAYVVSGRTGEILRFLRGSHMFEQFGHAVAGATDLDGDGVPDLAVGARFYDQDGGRRGRVSLYSGREGRLLGNLAGFNAGQEFGSTLLFVPDADGDGKADLLVGAAGRSRAEQGPAAVYQLSSASGSVLSTFIGGSTKGRFGASLDMAPDLDGDGHADLFVGAPHDLEGGLYSGACFAFSGRSGAVLWSCNGRSSLEVSEAATSGTTLMSLDRLQAEVAGYDFPVYDTTEVDAAPVIRRSGAAIYPPSQVGSGLTGWVKVKVLVLPDGTAAELEVTDDAGLGAEFGEAALAAVREWSFLPASRSGEEVACWVQVPIGFAPPLPPEEQRRLDSLAALTGATRLAVDSLPALPVLAGDSGAPAMTFYELDEVDTRPVLTARVEADYPSPALISGDTCTVALRILVNSAGTVVDVQLGEVSVRGKGFEAAASAAVRRWRFDAAIKAGERVSVWVPDEIRFVPPQPAENR